MARVPYVDREELDTEGQAIYDRIRQDRNAPKVGLQFRALLHNPKAAGYLTSMGAQLRFKSEMPEDLKEFAICVLSREWSSGIEWTAHSALAAKAGVSAEALESVRTGKAPAGLDDRQKTIFGFITGLVRRKEVPDDAFNAVQKLLGTKGAVDLVLTCSYYTAICMAQIALKPEMEEGKKSTL